MADFPWQRYKKIKTNYRTLYVQLFCIILAIEIESAGSQSKKYVRKVGKSAGMVREGI